MMTVLILFAMALYGSGVKAADNEAKTIQIQPGDQCLEVYDEYYTMNGGAKQNWTGDYVLTGTNVNEDGTSSPFQVKVDGYHSLNPDRSITLKDLTIINTEESEECAFYINECSAVELILSGENWVQSGSGQAGIRTGMVSGCRLSINGDGELHAQGGEDGAGIGGGRNESAGGITINGGRIAAYGAGEGAGIGGGSNGNVEGIEINGGSVRAAGFYGGAGIGGGSNGNAEYITINGGNVTAEGGLDNRSSYRGAAGIGGGLFGYGDYIYVNGGTIRAKGYGTADHIGRGSYIPQYESDKLFIQVTGGSIDADPQNYLYLNAYNNLNMEGSRLTRYTLNLKDGLGNAAAECSVQDLNIGGYTGVNGLVERFDSSNYGIKDMQTNAGGQIILYLDGNSIQNGTRVTLSADGKTFTGILDGTNADLTLLQSVTLQEGNHLTIWNDGYYVGADTDPSESEKTMNNSGYIIDGGQAASGVTVKNGAADKNIMISDLNIDSETPFVIENAASVNLTVSGTNTLRAGDGKAGLQVSEDGSVVIDGTGSLQAFGGSQGAGIGGTDGMTAGSITINSADITAVGETDAAGIGGGSHGAVTGIVLNGGTVTAAGGESGIGIGRSSCLTGKITVNPDVTLACVSGMKYGITPLTNNVYQQPVAQLSFAEQQTAGKTISLSDSVSISPVQDFQKAAFTVESGSYSVLLDGSQQGYDSGKETVFTIGEGMTCFSSLQNCISTDNQ